jgi:hypothetical protein
MNNDMPGYLVDIYTMLDWFNLSLVTEKQLSYALWIYGPGMSLQKVIWQMNCIWHTQLPQQVFYSFLP